MRQKLFLTVFSLCLACLAFGQTVRVYGTVRNTRLEPLAFVSIQVKDWKTGVSSRENGSYELQLEEGRYELVVSMIGYKSQVVPVVVQKVPYRLDLMMEEDEARNMDEVVVKGKSRDRSEEFIRNVIRNKQRILDASGSWSCELYIRATQEDSAAARKKGKSKGKPQDTAWQANAALNRMAMAEVMLTVDHKPPGLIREERTGIKKRGDASSLFYLSTTEGNFNFYYNLVKVPALSTTPFLSPVSYSGLLAYRFRLLKTTVENGRKIYTIGIRPRQLSNATVEGEITIADSLWVILSTKLSFPSYHLPEYDFFEVEQRYGLVNDSAWMISRQEFTYYSKSGKGKKSGRTVAVYRNFQLNRIFDKKHFGTEVSSTSEEAYTKDSSFWASQRTEPLTPKEVRFIQYKDSIYRVTHSKAYLDSMDRRINRITWKNVLISGQTFNNHEKERRWYLPPVSNIFQPVSFGGSRIQLAFYYNKIFKSKKNISLATDISYGLRNRDVNGSVMVTRMYNPFNRGFFHASVVRRFDFIFQGDAWINMLKRSNVYLNNALVVGHGLELVNGLFLYTDVDLAFRKSVSNYKTNSDVDEVLGDVLTNNQAVAFPAYNAVYGKIRLQYTPWQRYIREPREKLILGSAWPTFYTMWRKGVPGIFDSQVDFDYLEFGMEQQVKLGLAGISTYNIKTGDFLNQRDLRLVDYQFQRRGDPLLFLNPHEAFQALDSSFPVFRRFYQGHYVHEFNGALINKVPLLKKLRLREVGGAGFLVARERNLRYAEIFTGVERVFKWPFDVDSKFKLGVYVVGSVANQFRNPVMLKVGITSWD
ncbi:MAG TPA: DUF5686 and carboxypeptidase regulatory-like domain-containing protein, partial [Flavisolibacter sp.]|nr:DUF5686 and carboxypeptidase regulatory-like domain-containing protein [Flavisolibacter sp.]